MSPRAAISVRTAGRWALAVCVSLCLLAGVARAYSFFYAEELERELEARVGEQVSVVDVLVGVWEHQDVEGYLRFDTERFRCAIPTTETESIAYIREVAAKRAEGDRTPPLIHMFGKVDRPELWGEVEGGEQAGVQSEQIVLVCDRVEQPRARFFDEGH